MRRINNGIVLIQLPCTVVEIAIFTHYDGITALESLTCKKHNLYILTLEKNKTIPNK